MEISKSGEQNNWGFFWHQWKRKGNLIWGNWMFYFDNKMFTSAYQMLVQDWAGCLLVGNICEGQSFYVLRIPSELKYWDRTLESEFIKGASGAQSLGISGLLLHINITDFFSPLHVPDNIGLIV